MEPLTKEEIERIESLTCMEDFYGLSNFIVEMNQEGFDKEIIQSYLSNQVEIIYQKIKEGTYPMPS